MQDIPQLDTVTPASSAFDKPLDDHSHRSALLIVFLVMFIDLLGFGIVLPLLPRYGKEFLEPLFPGEGREVMAIRGGILGLLMASFSAMQFLFAPIWGRISDRKGRRPFLLLGLTGSVLSYALFGIASELGNSGQLMLGLVLLFVARIGAGIAGATVSTAQAVIADSTTPERRSRGMALIGVAFGIGFTFGPILGAGSLLLFPQFRGGPGFIASALSLVGLILGLALMPETFRPGVSAGRRNWFNWSGLQLARQTPTVLLLVLIYFLSTFAFASFEPTVALATKDLLGYADSQNFWVFAYIGFVLMLAQGVLYRRLAKRGVAETTFIMVGTALMLLGLGGLGGVAMLWASRPENHSLLLTAFLSGSTVAVVGFAFVTPSVPSLISRRTDPTKQGEILGVNQSANALSRILGPMAGTFFYMLTRSHALPYVVSVAVLILVLLLAVRVREA